MMLHLRTLAESEFASAYSGNFSSGSGNRWQWIAEAVAEHFHCDPDDVSTLDTEDDLDLITVKGEPVARIHREYGLMAS